MQRSSCCFYLIKRRGAAGWRKGGAGGGTRIKAYLSLCTSVHCCSRPLGANQVSGLRAVGVGLAGDGSPWIPPSPPQLHFNQETNRAAHYSENVTGWLRPSSPPQKKRKGGKKIPKNKHKTIDIRELFDIPSTCCQCLRKSGAWLLRKMPCVDQQQRADVIWARNNLQASRGKKKKKNPESCFDYRC